MDAGRVDGDDDGLLLADFELDVCLFFGWRANEK